MQQISSIPELLNRKFLVNPIKFEGLQRIEKGEYPVSAIREMLLNALVHRDYSISDVQLKVWDDKISIWNAGLLPEGLLVESLSGNHSSIPRNPIIADVCFKGGYIETWGTGTLKIIDSCKKAELPEPQIKEEDGGIIVTLFKDIYTEEFLKKSGLSERQIKAVLHLKTTGNLTNSIYQEINNVSKATATREIKVLMDKGIIDNLGSKGASARYALIGSK